MNEDAVLVELAQQGDADAFAQLYERYFDRLYDFLARLVRNDAEAADLAQDTFLKAMNSLTTLTKGASFKSWLFTIARNNALNRLERASRSQPLEGENDEGEQLQYDVVDTDRFGNPEEAAEAQSMAALVWEAARGLDSRSYSVLHLTVREGLESAEIAEVLGVTRNNAYVLVNRMKQALEDAVGALMLLRRGRRECGELDAVLTRSENAEMSPETRRVIDRHAATCENCRDRRAKMASPFGIFAAIAPLRPADAMRESVLSNLQAAFNTMHLGTAGSDSTDNPQSGASGSHAGADSWSSGGDDALLQLPTATSGAGAGTPPATPVSALPDDDSSHRRRKLLAAVAGAALLLVGGTGAIAFFSESSDTAGGQASLLIAGSPTLPPTSAVVATTSSPTPVATEPATTPVYSENEPEVPLAPGGGTGPTSTPKLPLTAPTATPSTGGGSTGLVASPTPTHTPTPRPSNTPLPSATASATATRTSTPSATPCVATMMASPGSITFTSFGQSRTVTLQVTGCGGPVSFTAAVPAGYNVVPASGSVMLGGSMTLSVERLTPSAPDGTLVINPSVGADINVTINAP